jgi:hypothetical protein
MSAAGIVPPTTTAMSPAPAFRRPSIVLAVSARCAPDRMDRPTTATSSWMAVATIASTFWRMPVKMISKPASRRVRATILAPRSWPSRPGFAMRILAGI